KAPTDDRERPRHRGARSRPPAYQPARGARGGARDPIGVRRATSNARPRADATARGFRVSGPQGRTRRRSPQSVVSPWQKGRATMDRVQIFDTTLRDGEQSPGATMNIEETLVIARQLERLGVDVIEAGFAASSEGDFEAVQRVAAAVTKPIVLSLARTREQDIDRALRAVEQAKRPGIHIFIATSDIHLKHKLMMTRRDVVDAAVWAVTRARKHLDHVEFSAEDASRSDPDYLFEVFGAVIEAGARVINVPDTTGYILPEEYGALFRSLRERVPGAARVIWSAHCHDDLGMATANSLA